MASKTIRFDVRGIGILERGFIRPFNRFKTVFSLLGEEIDKDAQLMFDTEGKDSIRRGGIKPWPPFSPRTLKTPAGTFKLRPGTTGTKTRRYSENSKLLQASGKFRISFKITKLTNNKLKYQTVHELGGKIGARPKRQILQVTAKDENRYGRIVRRFTEVNIKF